MLLYVNIQPSPLSKYYFLLHVREKQKGARKHKEFHQAQCLKVFFARTVFGFCGIPLLVVVSMVIDRPFILFSWGDSFLTHCVAHVEVSLGFF